MRKGYVQIHWCKNTSQKDDNQCSRENVATIFVCNPDKGMLMADINRRAAFGGLTIVVSSCSKPREAQKMYESDALLDCWMYSYKGKAPDLMH